MFTVKKKRTRQWERNEERRRWTGFATSRSLRRQLENSKVKSPESTGVRPKPARCNSRQPVSTVNLGEKQRRNIATDKCTDFLAANSPGLGRRVRSALVRRCSLAGKLIWLNLTPRHFLSPSLSYFSLCGALTNPEYTTTPRYVKAHALTDLRMQKLR